MRPEKTDIVSDLAEELNRSPFVLVTDYQHMNVNDFSELRNRLAQAGAQMHVVKNSFLKRAIADAGFPAVDETLSGQTAVVTGEKDVAPVAKIVKNFAKEFKKAIMKIGLVDKAIVSTKELETLAELPPREVLLGQLLGLLLSPATKLVRLLNEPGASLARLLNAKASKMPSEPVASAAPEVPAVEEKKEQPKAEAAPEPVPQAEPTKEEGAAPEAAG
jgi:large subunit ribosomal protein L10